MGALPLVSCSGWLLHRVTLDREHRLNGTATLSAFAPARANLGQLTAQIFDAKQRPVALATIIEPAKGLAVTKWSEVESRRRRLHVRFPSGWSGQLEVIAVDKSNDLALVRGEAQPLAAASGHAWNDHVTPMEEGDWVTALDAEGNLRIGIISGETRKIIKPGGRIGVALDSRARPGALIRSVTHKSPGQAAGLKPGDVITTVNGRAIESADELIEAVDRYDPGQTIQIDFKRANRSDSRRITLGDATLSRGEDRNLKMSGPVSTRRAGFTQILQHDTLLSPESMGGPLLDLEGDLVGVNIARTDRVSTYALPVDLVREFVRRARP